MAITKEEVLKMDLKSIHAAVKDPKTSAEMQNLLRDRQVVSRVSELMLEAQTRENAVDAEISRVVPPTTEELAAQAQAMAAEAPPAAATAPLEPAAPATPPASPVKPYEAEDAELKKIGITVVRDASDKVVRYIEEYQVIGEDGRPIGRPTHLEAKTLPEFFSKKREVHTQATRAFHRLKQQKLSFKNQEAKQLLTPEQISAAAATALQEKDPNKAQEVVREIVRTEFGKQELTLQERKDYLDGLKIGNDFRAKHLYDFNSCEANTKQLLEYLKEEQMEFTLDNLEAAFVDLTEQGKLVPVSKHRAEEQATVVVNPTAEATVAAPAAPAIPVAEPPAAVPASAAPAQPVAPSQPVVEATVPTPAAAPNVQPAARRPGVNGSLPPGTLSAQRPGAPEPALARKEFLQNVRKMDAATMKHKLKTDPQFVKQLQAYGIKVQ